MRKDHQLFAGLLSVTSAYPIHKNKIDADKAREDGNAIKEEANGKCAHLVAWFDEETNELCLHRTFENESYFAFYKHKLIDTNTLEVALEAIDGNSTAKTIVTFSRDKPE